MYETELELVRDYGNEVAVRGCKPYFIKSVLLAWSNHYRICDFIHSLLS